MASLRNIDEGEPLKVDDDLEERGVPSCTNTANTLLFLVMVLSTAVVEFTPSFLEKRFSRVYVRQSWPTLMTPDPVAHTLWILIFGMEAVFVVAQQSPRWCESALVKVVSPWWQMACIFQILWSALFAMEILLPAALVMCGCLFCLVTLIILADNQQWPSFLMFWFLRFPFSLHAGWAVAVSMMDVSILIHSGQVGENLPDAFVIGCNIGCIAVATTITLAFAVAVAKPDPFVCAGVAWAVFWIAVNLGNPDSKKANLPETGHTNTIIKGFEYLFYSLAFLFSGFAVLAYCLRVFQRCCMRDRHKKDAERSFNAPPGSLAIPKKFGSSGSFQRSGSSNSLRKGGSNSSFGSFGRTGSRTIKRGPSAKLNKSGSGNSAGSSSGGWGATLKGAQAAEKLLKKGHSKEEGGVQLPTKLPKSDSASNAAASGAAQKAAGMFGKLKGKSASQEDPLDKLERGESQQKLPKESSSSKPSGKEGASSKLPGKEGSSSKLPGKASSSSSTTSKSKLTGAASKSKEKNTSSSSVGEDKVAGSSSGLPRENSKSSRK